MLSFKQLNGSAKIGTRIRNANLSAASDTQHTMETSSFTDSLHTNHPFDPFEEASDSAAAGTNEPFLRLNVGGTSFRFLNQSLKNRHPNSARNCTFLARFARISHTERLKKANAFISETEEYYFERPSKYFNYIFDYEITGQLHRPHDECPERFLLELDFWEVSRDSMAPCCGSELGLGVTSVSTHDLGHLVNNGDLAPKEDPFEKLCCRKQRRTLWNFLEDPGSSIPAKIFALCSITFVLISVAGLILASIPDLQVPGPHADSEPQPNPVLAYAEFACIIWFTMEYIVRLLVAPKKWDYVKAPLNIIDLLTILPFFVELILGLSGYGSEKLRDIKGAMLVIRILRVLRVARIFKLARYSSGLKRFGSVVKHSFQELGMLSLFLVTALIFFSTVMYFLEKDEPNTRFTSIPAACWWCVVTMTTVGYGDLVPQTIGGKIVASITSISGVLVLAFPITMIVDNFTRHYPRKDDDGASSVAPPRRHKIGKFV